VEFLLLVSVIAAAIGGVGGLLFAVPFGRWRLTYAGHQLEVANYGLRERLLLDGEVVQNSKVGGDGFTYAEHACVLPDGRRLDVEIRSQNGLTMYCVVRTEGQVLLDSRGPRAALPQPVTPEPADPRWSAAKVLLGQIAQSDDDRVRAAGSGLGVSLRTALLRLDGARESIEAHRALGSGDVAAERITARREAEVSQLLGALQELHLAGDDEAPDDPEAATRVRSLLDRLDAEREAAGAEAEEAARRAGQAARRQRN
jgi:hypothetical protein